MYFLLNDVVLSLELQLLTPPVMARRFSALSLDCVSRLGREIFAEEPKLPHRAVERGRAPPCTRAAMKSVKSERCVCAMPSCR